MAILVSILTAKWSLNVYLTSTTTNTHKDWKIQILVEWLRSRSEGWPHHGRIFSIYQFCPLSFWLTLSRGVLSTYWCCPELIVENLYVMFVDPSCIGFSYIVWKTYRQTAVQTLPPRLPSALTIREKKWRFTLSRGVCTSSCVVAPTANAAMLDATTLRRLCRDARLLVLDTPPPPPPNRISSCDKRNPAEAELSRCWRCSVRLFCAFWKVHRSSDVGVAAAESSAYGRSRFSRHGWTSGRRAPAAAAAAADCGVSDWSRHVNWLLLRYRAYGDAGRLALDWQHITLPRSATETRSLLVRIKRQDIEPIQQCK